MNIALRRGLGQRYAFVVAGVVFLALMIAAGRGSAPSVLIVPLEEAFGWGRDTISAAAALSILLYGLAGPFAAALMESIGVRRTLIGALTLMAVSTTATLFVQEAWQLIIAWGLVGGIASGGVALVLGATIINRWFVTNRGLMMGLLTASTATGTLAFLPAMAALSQWSGWQAVVTALAVVSAALIPLVFFLVPERPADIGLRPFGTEPGAPPPPVQRRAGLLQNAFGTLGRAARTPVFWLLFGTFYVCGFTTNGLVGTHLIAFCGDMGIPEVQAAGLLAMMGVFDLLGTTLSGWLTDRYDARKLLFVYYGLRGLSLIYLPYSDFSLYSLTIFAAFYGLDWVATVPPTLKLANQAFGDRDAPVVFGWVLAGHQIGGASAAFFAGTMRELQGDYFEAFIIAGLTGVAAAFASLMIQTRRAAPPGLATA